MKIGIVIASILVFVPGLFAQELAAPVCNLDQTPQQCRKAVHEALGAENFPRAEVVDAAELAAQEERGLERLQSKSAPEITSLPGATAILEDFVTKLKLSATTTDLSDSGETALAVELTDFLGLDTKHGYKVQAVLRPAKLFEGLSDVPTEVAGAAAEGLDDFDDVLVTFSFAPTVGDFGRVNSILRDVLVSDDSHFQQAARDAATALGVELGKVPSAFSQSHEDPTTGELNSRFRDIPSPASGERLVALVEADARAQELLHQNTVRILQSARFFRLADLVANQPQLVFNASRTLRDRLVGPEETTVKFSYEMGFVNLNGLRRFAEKNCATLASDLACLDRFLDAKRMSSLKKASRGDRLTFSLDYQNTSDHEIALGDAMLDLKEVERWTGALGFGRNLRVRADGTVDLRAELTGSWEDWSDDPMHQDRGVARLTFTQRVTDDTSAVFGAVWATKPEFRGDVDKEVSARFGLTYSLDTAEE